MYSNEEETKKLISNYYIQNFPIQIQHTFGKSMYVTANTKPTEQ